MSPRASRIDMQDASPPPMTGYNLRGYRRNVLNLTQRAFAGLICVDQSTVARWEVYGARELPGYVRLLVSTIECERCQHLKRH